MKIASYLMTAGLIAATGACLMTPATADPLEMKIINAEDFSGPVITASELSVKYSGIAVSRVELWIAGKLFAQRVLETPVDKGVASFVVDPVYLNPGRHSAEVRVIQLDGRLTTSKLLLVVDRDSVVGLPIRIVSPTQNGDVQGKVEVNVAVNEGVKNPYVSIYIDQKFRSLKNVPPYVFTWDTATVSNGSHMIEAMLVDSSQNVYKAAPITVMVNNPGGFTMTNDFLSTSSAMLSTPPVTGTEPSVMGFLPAPAGSEGFLNSIMPTNVVLRPASPAPVVKAAVAAPKPGSSSVPSISVSNNPTIGLLSMGTSSDGQVRMSAPDSVRPAQAVAVAKAVEKAVNVIAPSVVKVKSAAKQMTDGLMTAALPGSALNVPGLLADKASAQGAVRSTSPSMPSTQTVVAKPVAVVAKVVEAKPVAVTAQPAPVAVKPASVKPTTAVAKVQAAPKAEPKVAEAKSFIKVSRGSHVRTMQIARNTSDEGTKSNDTFDVMVKMINGTAYVPFRAAFEADGYGKVWWYSKENTVCAVSNDRKHSVVFMPGANMVEVNGMKMLINNRPFINLGYTYMALDYMDESLDAQIKLSSSQIGTNIVR
ncbi:MAG: stalk domain-containing protein [Armatimonadota bacterium]